MFIGSDAIAKIISLQWADILDSGSYNSYQIRTLSAIRRCRTPELGGYRYRCDTCAKVHQVYHSCRNRHCPRCQNTERQQWISSQEDRLIGDHFYHIVYTVPQQLRQVFKSYPRQMYSLLMRTGWSVINDLGWNPKYLGAQIGATIVLHTWGSNLSYHPHIHCIVPGGGINLRGQWRHAKGRGKYLFPVKAMSKIYRHRMIRAIVKFLRSEGNHITAETINSWYQHDWVVYCKPPFGGKQGVIRYLARYTHKVAITHHRIKYYDDHQVRFSYIDYRHANKKNILSIAPREFIRRLTMHFLPKGFCRIRHYGIVSSTWVRRLHGIRPPQVKVDWISYWLQRGLDVLLCPHCKTGRLQYECAIEPVRGPPYTWKASNRTKTQHL